MAIGVVLIATSLSLLLLAGLYLRHYRRRVQTFRVANDDTSTLTAAELGRIASRSDTQPRTLAVRGTVSCVESLDDKGFAQGCAIVRVEVQELGKGGKRQTIAREERRRPFQIEGLETPIDVEPELATVVLEPMEEWDEPPEAAKREGGRVHFGQVSFPLLKEASPYPDDEVAGYHLRQEGLRHGQPAYVVGTLRRVWEYLVLGATPPPVIPFTIAAGTGERVVGPYRARARAALAVAAASGAAGVAALLAGVLLVVG